MEVFAMGVRRLLLIRPSGIEAGFGAVTSDWITFISFFDRQRTSDRCETQESPRPAIITPVTFTPPPTSLRGDGNPMVRLPKK